MDIFEVYCDNCQQYQGKYQTPDAYYAAGLPFLLAGQKQLQKFFCSGTQNSGHFTGGTAGFLLKQR